MQAPQRGFLLRQRFFAVFSVTKKIIYSLHYTQSDRKGTKIKHTNRTLLSTEQLCGFHKSSV